MPRHAGQAAEAVQQQGVAVEHIYAHGRGSSTTPFPTIWQIFSTPTFRCKRMMIICLPTGCRNAEHRRTTWCCPRMRRQLARNGSVCGSNPIAMGCFGSGRWWCGGSKPCRQRCAGIHHQPGNQGKMVARIAKKDHSQQGKIANNRQPFQRKRLSASDEKDDARQKEHTD